MGAAAELDRTLFVGNLDPRVTEELIFELFHQVPAAPAPPARAAHRAGPQLERGINPGYGGRRRTNLWV